MRSGSPAFGTPENSLANMAGGQLARFYKLPHRTSACNASNAVDVQATYETQMALWGAVLGHGNLIYHSAGWLEGGLVASFEKVITDCEMLQHMSYLLRPLKIDLEEIGLDAMQQVGLWQQILPDEREGGVSIYVCTEGFCMDNHPPPRAAQRREAC